MRQCATWRGGREGRTRPERQKNTKHARNREKRRGKKLGANDTHPDDGLLHVWVRHLTEHGIEVFEAQRERRLQNKLDLCHLFLVGVAEHALVGENLNQPLRVPRCFFVAAKRVA